MNDNILLTVTEMARADAAAIAAGTSGLALMEAAGTAVFEEVCRQRTQCPVTVLCGPGNNGGDGFVVARLLAAEGWPVRLALLGNRQRLAGDAAVNADRWNGAVEALDVDILDGARLVVDALFGAGLSRPLDGVARDVVKAINARSTECIAVDIPSGVDGNTGDILGAAPKAHASVTFFRAKPGHLLHPGRDLCGRLVVADIGIPAAVLGDIDARTFRNDPDLWLARLALPSADDNKYTRGHALVVGGDSMTGAARLAARGARRVGAGVLTIAAPPATVSVYAIDDPGNIIAPVDSDGDFTSLLEDQRKNAVLIGPGGGVNERTRRRVLAALAADKSCVLDADALTAFAGSPEDLFGAISGRGACVLTPHEGEFARLFDVADDKLTRARRAAATCRAVVLLKGTDTVIAAPDGRAAINVGAPPELATAGSGDVLAGMIVGLLARGMDGFDAACAAAWMHGAAASGIGPGLIAEDIPEALPAVLRSLNEAAVAGDRPGATD